MAMALGSNAQTVASFSIMEQTTLDTDAPCSFCTTWRYARDGRSLYRWNLNSLEWELFTQGVDSTRLVQDSILVHYIDSAEVSRDTVRLNAFNVDDADADSTNELQNIQLTGTLLSITQGDTVDLASIQNAGSDTTYSAGSGALVTASGPGITFTKTPATGEYDFTIPEGVILYHALVDGDVGDTDGSGELYVSFEYLGTRTFNQDLATAWRPQVWVWESGGSGPSRASPKNILPVNVQGISRVSSGDIEIALQNVNTITPNPIFQFRF